MAHATAPAAITHESFCAMASFRRTEKLWARKSFTRAVRRLTSTTGSSSARPLHSLRTICSRGSTKAAACSSLALIRSKLRHTTFICIHLPPALAHKSSAATGAYSVDAAASNCAGANSQATFCASAASTATAQNESVLGSPQRPSTPVMMVERLISAAAASSTAFTSRNTSGFSCGESMGGTAPVRPAMPR